MYVGNIYNWNPPMKFDFVRTELVYVPINKRKELIEKLLHQFINPGGKLIICEYRGSKDPQDKAWCDEELSQYGFNVLEIKSGFYEGKELTRAVVLG